MPVEGNHCRSPQSNQHLPSGRPPLSPIRFLTPADLRGLARLAGDGVAGTSRLVEQLHHTISSGAPPLGKSVEGPARGITGLVYRSIRGINAVVGTSIDLVASRMTAVAPAAAAATAAREHWLAVLNGIVGDHLAASRNPLAIPMRIRQRGRTLLLEREHLSEAFASPSNRLLITAHGLCMNDLHWGEPGMPQRLGRALGFTPLHLHYNSGRAIADNGRELAGLLETLVEQWPVPVDEIVIIGHSMGGLVARSALAEGKSNSHAWVAALSRMAFLGTPHHGAPLERLGHRFESVLGWSPYSAPFTRLGRIRSAGITDLRHGGLPAPGGEVELFVVAATARIRIGALPGHAVGDGLVPVGSALGDHDDPEQTLAVPESNRLVVAGAGHLGLLRHPAVYRGLHRWLRRRPGPR